MPITTLENMDTRRLGRTAAILAAISCALAAQAQTPVTACGTAIANPGDYYLDADLSCTGKAVTILSSNVSLRLNGHTITSLTPNNDPAIQAGTGATRFHHISISGPGLINGSEPSRFGFGVLMMEIDHGQISRLAINRSNIWAIQCRGCASTNILQNVVGRGNAGISLSASTSCLISGNESSGNVSNGILVNEGTGNSVFFNWTSGNGVAGISLSGASGTRVTGNTSNANRQGILVIGGGNQITGNGSVRANDVYDLVDLSPTCAGNTWRNNNFITRSAGCIH